MRFLFLLCFLIRLARAEYACDSFQTGLDWYLGNSGFCYGLVKERLNFYDAQGYCFDHFGGLLPVIRSEYQQMDLEKFFMDETDETWIGGVWYDSEYQWIWVVPDGWSPEMTFNYSGPDWNMSDGRYYTGQCLAFQNVTDPTAPRYWTHYHCLRKFQFICQRHADNVIIGIGMSIWAIVVSVIAGIALLIAGGIAVFMIFGVATCCGIACCGGTAAGISCCCCVNKVHVPVQPDLVQMDIQNHDPSAPNPSVMHTTSPPSYYTVVNDVKTEV